ncbi:MAG: hypothetical protein M1818_004497 [Claussenomyces sp. TS43310]|nr:MAG: hypothetical protein M1818_004497 [Claussenomyces sp. TS43310]
MDRTRTSWETLKGRRGASENESHSSSGTSSCEIGMSEHTVRIGDVNLQACGFLRAHRMRYFIEAWIFTSASTLPVFILPQIWTRERLLEFLPILYPPNLQRPEDFDGQEAFVTERLLWTLSILIMIEWPHWSQFWNIFMIAEDLIIDECSQRQDLGLPHGLATLQDDGFLGKIWGTKFGTMQATRNDFPSGSYPASVLASEIQAEQGKRYTQGTSQIPQSGKAGWYWYRPTASSRRPLALDSKIRRRARTRIQEGSSSLDIIPLLRKVERHLDPWLFSPVVAQLQTDVLALRLRIRNFPIFERRLIPEDHDEIILTLEKCMEKLDKTKVTYEYETFKELGEQVLDYTKNIDSFTLNYASTGDTLAATEMHRVQLGPPGKKDPTVSETLAARQMKFDIEPEASPATLTTALYSENLDQIHQILTTHFHLVAIDEYVWLRELREMGCSYRSMAEILFDEARDSPWVYPVSESPVHEDEQQMQMAGFHQEHCVHKGGVLADTSVNFFDDPRPPVWDVSRLESCGLAGIYPSREESNYIGTVAFEGIYNEKASIAYVVSPGYHHFKMLASAYVAMKQFVGLAGYLQNLGICCDSFTLLRYESKPVGKGRDLDNDQGFVELYRVELSDAADFFLSMDALSLDSNDVTFHYCMSAAMKIVRIVQPSTADEMKNQRDWSILGHACSLAAQMLSLSLYFYAQGHTGEMITSFLRKPLSEIELLGTNLCGPCVRAKLHHLSCMGDMTEGPVMVFQALESSNPHSRTSFDLLASAEDIVDTWGESQFLVDNSSKHGDLYGIQIKGGVIRYYPSNAASSADFHWSRGFDSALFQRPQGLQTNDTFMNPAAATFVDSGREASPVGASSHRVIQRQEDGKQAVNDDLSIGHGEEQLDEAHQPIPDLEAGNAEGENDREVIPRTATQADVAVRRPSQALQGRTPLESIVSFKPHTKILIGATTVNSTCPLDKQSTWIASDSSGWVEHLGPQREYWEANEQQIGLQAGQYAVLQFNRTLTKRPGVTLKQYHLNQPPNRISIPFLESPWGLQVSFCTGVARRVALREVLADVVPAFVEAQGAVPQGWDALKNTHDMIGAFKGPELKIWLNALPLDLQILVLNIVHRTLNILKDTGIDSKGEHFSIAWARPEDPFSCFRIPCKRASFWAKILTDTEDCATFAAITSQCLETEDHKCRGLTTPPWHNTASLLDTAVCRHMTDRFPVSSVPSGTWALRHERSYWIGKPTLNLRAKVSIVQVNTHPHLYVSSSKIPEGVLVRLGKMHEKMRAERIRERQVGGATAEAVLILADD